MSDGVEVGLVSQGRWLLRAAIPPSRPVSFYVIRIVHLPPNFYLIPLPNCAMCSLGQTGENECHLMMSVSLAICTMSLLQRLCLVLDLVETLCINWSVVDRGSGPHSAYYRGGGSLCISLGSGGRCVELVCLVLCLLGGRVVCGPVFHRNCRPIVCSGSLNDLLASGGHNWFI